MSTQPFVSVVRGRERICPTCYRLWATATLAVETLYERLGGSGMAKYKRNVRDENAQAIETNILNSILILL